MCRARPDPMTRFQKLALTTAVATIVLFAVGGLVRGTGSGLGCSTLARVHTRAALPRGHRALADRVLAPVPGLRRVRAGRRDGRRWRGAGTGTTARSLWPAVAAIPLVFGQAVLGGIVVHTELNPWWVTTHFAVALAFVADVIFVATYAIRARDPAANGREPRGGERGFARLASFTTGATGALLLVGTYVRARSAGLAFVDWPLMNGRLVPALGGAATAMFVHRVLAASVFLLVLWVAIRARTMAARSKDLVVLSTLALGLFLGQIVSGAAERVDAPATVGGGPSRRRCRC